MLTVNFSSYSPVFKPRKMKWENTLYMGLELELEAPYQHEKPMLQELGQTLKRLRREKLFYGKEDCSLDDGVELVSQPFTLQYAHNKLRLTELMTDIHNSNHIIVSRHTGIHVHLSRAFFTPYDLKKLRAFFKTNFYPYLKSFSLRKDTKYGGCDDHFSPREFITANAERINAISRDNCLAICNNTPNTVEIRLFASTTNPERMKAILHFCDAVSHFIKFYSLALILNQKTCWQEFINWCYKENRYHSFLKNWFDIVEGEYVETKYQYENIND